MSGLQLIYPPHVRDGVLRSRVLIAECLALAPFAVVALAFDPAPRIASILGVILVAAGAVEGLFAVVQKRRWDPRCIFSGLLFVSMLSPSVPLGQAAVCMALGTVVSKKRFGSARLNCLHPALTAYAALICFFPASQAGVRTGTVEELIVWEGAFAVAAGLGAMGLLRAGLRNGRIMAALFIGFLGGMIASFVFAGFDVWPDRIAGLCFAGVFLMADPYTGPFTRPSQWIFGLGTGILMAIFPAAMPASPEVFFLLLLLCNALAPVMDDYVVARHKEQLKLPPQRSLV
ncbi:MAG TPA: RnfABCDGE type electron transport complex subunit D [Candidatus Hydrogenedentes bacterium]|nr:RnfABCDGE type electron transport complex subunit D [Candidatus Hydrogenedentota bacterium]